MSAVMKWSLGFVLASLASLAAPAVAQTTVRYVHTDALGSVVAMTDQNGAVVERREYEPYGQQLTALENGPGYTGHVQDAATGLTYMQQRYYDPRLGVFLSVDPVVADASRLRHFNRYIYAYANPYLFSDPDGRAPSGPFSHAWRFLARAANGDTAPPPSPPTERVAASDIVDVADRVVVDPVKAAAENVASLGGMVDIKASAAAGQASASVNLTNGETTVGYSPVATGKEASVTVSLREPLIEITLVDNPVEAPVSISYSTVNCSGGLCFGLNVDYNPGGTVGINPEAGFGGGNRQSITPSVDFRFNE